MLSLPNSHSKLFFLTFFVLLYQKDLSFGLAAAFLTYLNNPIGQPDKAVKSVVMFLLLLTTVISVNRKAIQTSTMGQGMQSPIPAYCFLQWRGYLHTVFKNGYV